MNVKELARELLVHNPQICSKEKAIVHSQEEKGAQNIWVTRERINNRNEYLALANGKFCTAIFNIFTGYFYADDIYGEIKP